MAALAIVIFHIWWYEPEPNVWLESTNWIVDAALLRIRAGVQVLLVISGFVIAYTLRDLWVTPHEFLSFVLRRLVRLIPPYWIALGSVLLVNLICRQTGELPSPFQGDLSLPRVSTHLVFLHDIFGFEALSAGIWTVCIEIQFYLVAIIGWVAAQRFFIRPSGHSPTPSAAGLLVVFAPAAFVSLFYWRILPSTTPWVIHFFWMFFLGMVTWWAIDRTLSSNWFAVIVLIAVMELTVDEEWRFENAVALVTSLMIFLAGKLDQLDRWLNWGWLQHLGRISYSLYLIHFPVSHLVTTAGWEICGDRPNAAQATLILSTALLASLVAAQLLYSTVEAPSSKLSARLRRSAH